MRLSKTSPFNFEWVQDYLKKRADIYSDLVYVRLFKRSRETKLGKQQIIELLSHRHFPVK